MRLGPLEETGIELMYLSATRGGGRESIMLRVERAQATCLPEGVDALLVTSDLQGRCPSPIGAPELLGRSLARMVAAYGEAGSIPPAGRVGVVLAGDLYAAPESDERGASGDVTVVWSTFADHFAWVVGVAGNHDHFGTEREARQLTERENVHLLDGRTVMLGGRRFGGVGGIIGHKSAKGGRRSSDAFLALLDRVVDEQPDVLLLHEGPNGDDRELRGNTMVRSRVEGAVPWVVCGHVHWPRPVAELAGTRVLNVDARALLLVRDGPLEVPA